MVQYFKKRPVISQSPSDAGTANTEEASHQMNHIMEASTKYIITQVKRTYYTLTCVFIFIFSNDTCPDILI